MVRAAAKIYLPSKLLQVIDPVEDADLLDRFQLEKDSSGAVAYVMVRKAHVARTTDPMALAAAMEKAGKEKSR